MLNSSQYKLPWLKILLLLFWFSLFMCNDPAIFHQYNVPFLYPFVLVIFWKAGLVYCLCLSFWWATFDLDSIYISENHFYKLWLINLSFPKWHKVKNMAILNETNTLVMKSCDTNRQLFIKPLRKTNFYTPSNVRFFIVHIKPQMSRKLKLH